jgi:hypothetical protein
MPDSGIRRCRCPQEAQRALSIALPHVAVVCGRCVTVCGIATNAGTSCGTAKGGWGAPGCGGFSGARVAKKHRIARLGSTLGRSATFLGNAVVVSAVRGNAAREGAPLPHADRKRSGIRSETHPGDHPEPVAVQFDVARFVERHGDAARAQVGDRRRVP